MANGTDLPMRSLRVILFDLETLPDLDAMFDEIPSLGNFPGRTIKATINSVICFGYKKLGESTTKCVSAWDFKERWEKNVNDDYAVCKAAYNVLKGADVVVTHNGKRFDWKVLQTRLARHGMGPLPPIVHIDTLQESKKNLLAYSNSLKHLSKFFKIIEKKEHDGWPLWKRVHKRQPGAMRLMASYCRQDVRVLEQIFKILRPFLKSLPNANLFTDGSKAVCPVCGSDHLQRRGERVSKTKRSQRYQCQECGTWCSDGAKHPVVTG